MSTDENHFEPSQASKYNSTEVHVKVF